MLPTPFITYCLLALHPNTKEFHRTGPQVPSPGIRQIPSDRVQDSSQQHTILKTERSELSLPMMKVALDTLYSKFKADGRK